MCEKKPHSVQTFHCGRSALLSLCVFLLPLFLTLFAHNASAATASKEKVNSLCPVIDDNATQYNKPRAFTKSDQGNTEIGADATMSSGDGTLSLDGNVIIEQHLLRVSADHANYNKQEDTLSFSGNVHIDTESISLDANKGSVDMNATNEKNNKQGNFSDVTFFIPDNNLKGIAKNIVISDHEGKNTTSTLKDASITSCNLFDPDWLISADEIKLDHDDEYGTADDVVIRFKGVPFLYTPYIEFPTSDKRRSGFLFPEIGTSSSRGIELAAPWYWNIAPNHDALIVPRYMDKRGIELGGNYRYLTKSSEGTLNGAYLPNDDVTQDTRYQVRYQQHTRLLSNLTLDVDLQDISDAEYLNDFTNDLSSTSQTHLNRSANLHYNLDNWHLRALLQDIKTIDTTTPLNTRPFERLPQLTLDGDTEIANTPLLFTLDSEYVDFTHEDETLTTGTRLTLRPGLRLPLSGPFWFLEPAVKFSHTQYDVGNNIVSSQAVDNRNLPISSIDAGLFFERTLENGYQQTLEPRLYYLNVPFEEQNNTPIFDTSIPDFSVAQLFRDNRFIGGDRIGDANQLTLALTSRILNTATGVELIRASIGQIFFFENRRVSLDGNIDTGKQSDIIAELDTTWGRWQTNVDLQWDTSNNTLSKENYFLHYKSDKSHLFNIGYRKRLIDNDIDIEQTDTSFVYAINREYNSFFRWNYSIHDHQNIDIIAGISYNSCCWSLQLLAQRRLLNTNSTTDNDAFDNSILVQFRLKGLGSLSGSKARKTLERSIYGYSDTLQ
ncbi:MAG: LPS-assembly protein LptD [Gammaproteobacteria bacterium]|nr:LPS-assembly protein LptD [Gammaproteobacteria bacterium]